jgi:nucleoside-diphosphate-sugar epimerase
VGVRLYDAIPDGKIEKMKILLFGNGHVGNGISHNEKLNNQVEIVKINSKNIKDFRLKNPYEFEYVVLGIGASGGVAYNIEYGKNLETLNLQLNQTILNIIDGYKGKVINLVPSCVYPTPKNNKPIEEHHLGIEPLEPTSALYARTQLSRINELNQNFGYHRVKNLVVTNVFGISASSNANSHFFDHLLQKINLKENKEITLHGSGTSIRDFIYNKDIGNILKFVIAKFENIENIMNFGGYGPMKIEDIAKLFCRSSGQNVNIVFEEGKNAGANYKVLDDTKARKLGWMPEYDYESAFKDMIHFNSYSK